MTTIIFTALVPVFTVISAGYFCRRASFPAADFWPGAERITYFFLFPAVLFAALPGSASSYILARQLGGDSELMAAIVSAQIMLSPLTLPLFLSFALHT